MPTPPEDVNEYGKIGGIDKSTPKKTPNQDAFQSYMKEDEKVENQPSKEISPIELAQKNFTGTEPTMQSVTSQADNLNTKLDEVKNQLNTPKLQLKRSQQQLLKNKLADTHQNIRNASEKIGSPLLKDYSPASGANPIEKFIGYVTNGQSQLAKAKMQLQELSQSGKQLEPGQMLLIQVNLSQAQQQLEYSSVLLSQVINAINKTLNIQI